MPVFFQKFIYFFAIGILNTLFYYLTYALLIYLHLHYSLAVFSATFLTMIISFKSFGVFVFKNSDNRLFFKFILVTILNYLLNIIIIYFLKKYEYNSYTAGFISAIIVAINSFFLNNFFVFKQNQSKDKQ